MPFGNPFTKQNTIFRFTTEPNVNKNADPFHATDLRFLFHIIYEYTLC